MRKAVSYDKKKLRLRASQQSKTSYTATKNHSSLDSQKKIAGGRIDNMNKSRAQQDLMPKHGPPAKDAYVGMPMAIAAR